MKRIGLLWLALGLAAATFPAWSAPGFVKGQVEYMRTHDGASNPGWAPPRFWVTLKGVSSAGSCRHWTSGTVLFVFNDSQSLSFLLAAYTAGHQVVIHYDDALTQEGFCVGKYATLGEPAILAH